MPILLICLLGGAGGSSGEATQPPGGAASPYRLRAHLRGVVRERCDQRLGLAAEAPEVVVAVNRRPPVVLVDRVLYLTHDLPIPLEPAEVVVVQPDPQVVLRPDEEHVALRAGVVREERHPVEVDVLEPSVELARIGVVEPLLSFQRVHVAPPDTTGGDDELALPALRANVVQNLLALVFIKRGRATGVDLSVPVLVAGSAAVCRVQNGVGRGVDDVAEALDLHLPVTPEY